MKIIGHWLDYKALKATIGIILIAVKLLIHLLIICLTTW